MIVFLLFIAFLVSWALVFVTTPLLVRFAEKVRLFDVPSNRKVHQVPTPRLGGLALFSAFFVPFVIFYFLFCFYLHLPLTYLFHKPDWLGVFIGATLIFLTGFFDDIRGVPSWLKFACQNVSALAIIFGGLGLEKIFVPPFGIISLTPAVSTLITVLWCLVIINGFNLIDGMDGLAAGTAFICAFFLLIVAFLTNHYYMTLPIVMLAGATIGFLHYNFNPARIFMGDSGSYFLGYALAAIALKISRDDTSGVHAIVPVAVIFIIPAMDVIVATLRRIARKEHIFEPDCEHIHHCILNKGFSQRRTVFLLYGVNFVAGVLGISFFYLPPVVFWLLLLMIVASIVAFVSRFGYFNWLNRLKIVVTLKSKLNDTRFHMSLLKDFWSLENASSLQEMRKKLAAILARLNIDHARLIVFSPPLVEKSPVREILYSNKPQSLLTKPSVPLQLNIPLIREKTVYGYLFVEKNVMETNLPQKLFLTLLERTAKAVLSYISKSRHIANDYIETDGAPRTSNESRKQTYVLIAKVPSPLEKPH